MPAYPFNPSSLHWRGSKGPAFFRPNGKIVHHGDGPVANPASWRSARTVSARVIVGFNVGQDPTWTMEDVIRIVRAIRTRQVGNPSSTFVAQKGIYQHKDGTGIVEENGAQIFIINLSGATDDEFSDQMVALGEELCRRLDQEEVVVEVQVNGISQYTMGVSP